MLDELCERLLDCVARPSIDVKWNLSFAYQSLDLRDKQLANIWVNNGGSSYSKNHEFELSQMLSARAAEKIASNFYRLLGYTVTDVSISQLQNSSDDWKTFDLLVESPLTGDKWLIDVKTPEPRLIKKVGTWSIAYRGIKITFE